MRECGEILGVTSKLAPDSRNAKHILEHIFAQVVEFKKLNQVSCSLENFINPSFRIYILDRSSIIPFVRGHAIIASLTHLVHDLFSVPASNKAHPNSHD